MRAGSCRAEDEAQAAHRLGHIAAARWSLAGGADQQVGAAFEQRFPAAGERLLQDAQARAVGDGIKGLDVSGQRDGRKQRIHPDREARFPARGDASHPCFQVFGSPQQVPAFVAQLAACGRERHSGSVALEQGHAQRGFELRDGVGDRRGHLVQQPARRREGAAAVDRVQDLQALEGQPEHSKKSMMYW